MPEPSDLVILIPVLGRPDRVARLLESIDAACPAGTLPLFLVTGGDRDQVDAVLAAGAATLVCGEEAGDGDYARKMNQGARFAGLLDPRPTWLFLAADDVRFHEGWLDECLRVHAETGACVIGTNDLGNQKVMRGEHSTHTLVHVDYLECGTADDPTRLVHEGYSHNFCNPPYAPIWMADLSFKQLGEVAVGDEVMGWQRAGANVGGAPLKRLGASRVLEVGQRVSSLVRVALESGRQIVCTPDHNWLNAAWSPSSSHPREWVTPNVGRQLLHVAADVAPVDPAHERLAGWLAGIYDGEGSGVYVATQCKSRNPEVYAAISAALDELNVPYSLPESGRSVGYFNLTGGRQGYLNFLLRIKPVKTQRLAAKIIGSGRFGHRDRVVSVEPEGTGEVVSLTTSTGNYVAWGYASKNCDNELVETARWRGTFAAAVNAHVEHLHPFWHKGGVDATYLKGQAGFARDQRLYLTRRHLWGR